MDGVEPDGRPNIPILARQLNGGFGGIELRTHAIHANALFGSALDHFFTVVVVRHEVRVRMRIEVFHVESIATGALLERFDGRRTIILRPAAKGEFCTDTQELEGASPSAGR